MRTALFFVIVFFAVPVFCQNVDSLAVVREVDSLIQISRAHTGISNFDQALEVNAAAEKIALEKLGPESAAYGSCCFNHGRVLYFNGDYPEAEKWFIDSKAIREKALGKDHPDYAWSLNNLAVLYLNMGQYENAEPLFLESKAIREKALGKDHPDYAGSLNNLAVLLLPGTEQPRFIPLFEEKSLDSLLHTSGERRADYVNHLYTLAERGAAPLGKPQKTLYELLWQPLEKDLAGVKTIYFSPSGLLHRLNLGAVPISEEETLGDHYKLVEMGSTRQLVVPHPMVNSEKTAMLFGGIQYEMDSIAMAQANQSIGSDELLASRGELSFANTDSTLRGGAWSYLKWTDKEVTALEPILKTAGIQASARKGFAATEESFKAIGAGRLSPRILHLATHGYFFPDPKTSAKFETSPTSGAAEPVFKISDHPMLRSGLILAGGNAAWQGAKTLEGREDGILTAYEISQMNLSNTELVVLSACETGLGDIQGNEGVYGLQRAFKIAGAKYLVMSLWQVPDQETSVFMTTFYRHWLEGKMSIPDAFRTTQQEMRERFINPYQWAGFVLVE